MTTSIDLRFETVGFFLTSLRGFGGDEGRADEAVLTEGWYWQEPSGLLSSVNMASQPIRWHRTGVAAALFAASVVVDIAGAPSAASLCARSGKVERSPLALDPAAPPGPRKE